VARIRLLFVMLVSTTFLVGAVWVGQADAMRAGYSARISAPPLVERAGGAYSMGVTIRNGGTRIRNFCADFTDANNSWLFRPAAPLMRSYDSDTFCLTLAHGTTTLRWVLIAANRGAHKLSVTLGHASIYKEINNAVITDSRALYWEDQIVIT
jgi:hypothetical protein